MPLDTRIALTGQPLQLESPAAQYSQLMSVVNAGTQNQLAQMQISAAQRAMLEEEGVQNYLADPTNDLTTPEGQRGLLRLGKPGQAALKSLAEQRKEQALANKSSYEFETQKLDKALSEISNFPDAPSALASIDTQVSRKIISPEQATQLKAQINAAPDFATWQRRTVTGMMAAKDRLDILEEQRYLASRVPPAAAASAAPAAVVPTAPVDDTKAPLVRPTQAAVPLGKLNVSQDARGNKTYYLDGVPIPEEKFAELFAASAAPAPLSGTRAAGLASMAPAAVAAPTPAAVAAPAAVAPMAPAAPAPAAAAAPTAPPDMANALALKIQGLQEQRNQLEPFLRSSSAKLKYEDLGKQIDNLSKGFSISPDGTYVLPSVGTFKGAPSLSETQKEVAVLANPNASQAAKDAATKRIAKLVDIPAKSVDGAIERYEYAKKNSGYKGSFTDFIVLSTPKTTVSIDQKQEGAFATGLGTGQSKRVLESQETAQAAADILATNEVGRSLLTSGAITGAGADFFVGLNKALKHGGIDFGYADAATNSQAYGSAMAANVGKLIKQFGAGTAISDADREYATKAAAGEISMDETAIRKVLDINDRAARSVIERHNKSVKGIKTNIPLEVAIPAAPPPPPTSGAALIPGSKPAATGGNVVTLPDGRTKTFPTAEAANQFKKAAGL